jgi:hypothetical protein
MEPFKEYTTIASTEIRKLVYGLILAVFGLAYKDNGITLSGHIFLQIALTLFFLFIFLDILQYFIGARQYYYNVQKEKIWDTVLYFFVFKIFSAIAGLIFCCLSIFDFFEKMIK